MGEIVSVPREETRFKMRPFGLLVIGAAYATEERLDPSPRTWGSNSNAPYCGMQIITTDHNMINSTCIAEFFGKKVHMISVASSFAIPELSDVVILNTPGPVMMETLMPISTIFLFSLNQKAAAKDGSLVTVHYHTMLPFPMWRKIAQQSPAQITEVPIQMSDLETSTTISLDQSKDTMCLSRILPKIILLPSWSMDKTKSHC